ncbi:fimbrial protein [Klebsiella spallanzanii]|uniref:fimbrial protein n=1 Tax=Klebsiella spallanzanii TaxID=2587528 RepID=UPI0011575BC6|nr:fimbrial protein [Klebsiella spallanzanii]VUS96500.1 hypothetical protein SB6419_01531 [Klebsiella spallanzanii]
MKNKIPALPLALFLTLASPAIQAADGSLSVNGAISDSTCSVLGVISESDIGIAQPVLNPVITLGFLSDDENMDTRMHYFQIHLKNCYTTASHQNVRINLTSPHADSDGLLHNEIPNGAKGKIIHIHERDDGTWSQVRVGAENTLNTQPLLTPNASGDGIIRFRFLAVASNGIGQSTIPGPFSTSMNYEMEYQ